MVLLTLAAGILLTLCAQGQSLSPPTRVSFENSTFYYHILTWKPGLNSTGKVMYEVQFKGYGNSNWELVKHCAPTLNLSCDLTTEMMNSNQNFVGYYGRVRAVLEDQISEWKRTSRFSPQDVILPAPHLSLNLERNTVHIEVKFPSLRRRNITVEFTDIFKYNLVYKMYVRRASDNFTFVQVVHHMKFDLSNLVWGQQYCISVCAESRSRPNPGTVSKEHCVFVQEEARTSANIIIILACVSIFIFTASAGTIYIYWHINRPVSTPEILKSFGTRSSCGMTDQQWCGWDYSTVQCLDDLTPKKMVTELKSRCGSTDSGICSEKHSLENTCSSFILTLDNPQQTRDAGAPPASEHSCSSANSSIYSGGMLFGCKPLLSESKRQIKATDSSDSGISMERDAPYLTQPAGRREQPTLTYKEEMQKGEPGQVHGTGECGEINESQAHTTHCGYVKQSKCLRGSFQSQEVSSNDRRFSAHLTDSAEKAFSEEELQCSVLGQTKGYLKQPSRTLGLDHSIVTSAHTERVFLKEPGMMVVSASLELRNWGLYHENPLTPIDLKCHTNPKVTSGGRDLVMPFPLTSSLHSNDMFTLGINTLSLADMELEDGHM